MDNLHWLEEIKSIDRTLVGDKAFFLSRVMQRGYPVVPGFVVPAIATHEFLESVEWSEPLGLDLPYSSLHLDVDNPKQLQHLAQKIRQEITAAALPESWLENINSAQERWHSPVLILRPSLALVGSSASVLRTSNWSLVQESGLLESHTCLASPEALAAGLKISWAELFRARSLFYWQSSGIQVTQINLGILVQPLMEAIASGTLHVLPELWEIQATWGMGKALFRGEVVPDSYQVQPETGEVQTRNLGIKTRAYRIKQYSTDGFENSTDSVQVAVKAYVAGLMADEGLEPYLLDEEQQKNYALSEKNLNDLINLARQLKAELGPAFSLEWIISPHANEGDKLYLTQVSIQQAAVNLRESEVRDRQPAVSSDSSMASFNSRPAVHSLSSRSSPTSHNPLEGDRVVRTSGLTPTASQQQHSIKGLAAAAGQAIAIAHVLTENHHTQWSQADGVSLPAVSGKILVTKNITPDLLPLLRQAAGVIAEQGGMTCHAAIVARELGIPAVVGAIGARQLIQSGDSVLLDGDRGEVYRLSDEESLVISQKPLAKQPPISNFQFPIATQLLVNLSQPSSIERAANLPVDGVGLLRSELLVLDLLEGQHPHRWLQQGRDRELVGLLSQKLCEFAAAFAPRPVFYRSLDLRSHEFLSLIGSHQVRAEANPMLGNRGTFSATSDPALFDLEMAALASVQQSGYTNMHLILPFVRTVEEFSFCRQRAIAAGLTESAQFQLWIMAEVPSVLFLLADYVKAGCMGISIGSNDLTQLLLGVDREHAQMASAFDERHPAVIQAIAQLIAGAKQAGIPCSICGQAPAQYPELIDQLVQWGITSISVEPDAVERTYNAIARAEQRLILEAARRQLG
ncbi:MULTISPECIES: putative PEP-binding protein [Cyanophyceae]|uniref:putative PEP-binding protein n=1 Tax=Cyanophyceae TaxID=3028117 RepID=UPI0016896667|nr:putative PEP-binding protein [Trichocoleus sp. FACHB-40]MBD2002212.1 hypothetical protein [Trichocoleus sp. FACHB-40]